MLNLQSKSSQRWLDQVDADLESVLIDHAHCEKKAAGTAMNLMFAYPGNAELCLQLSDIVVEELEHFRLVIDLLEARGIKFRTLRASSYGRRLGELVRKQDPDRAIDRLLVAALIEARSCERFALLRDHVADKELADFYGSLFESEARHHTTYVRMARLFAPDDVVDARLCELSAEEAGIIELGDSVARMHS